MNLFLPIEATRAEQLKYRCFFFSMNCNFIAIQRRHLESKPKSLEWSYLSKNYWKSTPNATNLKVDVSGRWRHQNLKSLYLGQFSSDLDNVFFLNFCFLVFYPLICSVRRSYSPFKRWKFLMQFVSSKWKSLYLWQF